MQVADGAPQPGESADADRLNESERATTKPSRVMSLPFTPPMAAGLKYTE